MLPTAQIHQCVQWIRGVTAKLEWHTEQMIHAIVRATGCLHINYISYSEMENSVVQFPTPINAECSLHHEGQRNSSVQMPLDLNLKQGYLEYISNIQCLPAVRFSSTISHPHYTWLTNAVCSLHHEAQRNSSVQTSLDFNLKQSCCNIFGLCGIYR